MKHSLLTLILLFALAGLSAQSVDRGDLERAANQFIRHQVPEAELRGTETLLSESNQPLGMIFRYSPAGFVISPLQMALRPVYAYSATGDLNLSGEEMRIFRSIIIKDLLAKEVVDGQLLTREKRRIEEEWSLFLTGEFILTPYQQWPPEGTTATGGWVETNWKQSAPYNNMCPMDLNAGARSIAGCPAIAMAQIVNYHQTLNSTNLGDNDDYFHSYGSGNQYWIDDDHETWEFPSFDSLNSWLNSMDYAYQTQQTITTEMKAALCFACGVGARSVYSASMSGTFGIDQAWESFQRFGYEESRLIFPDDTTLNAVIAENVKLALPVQLGLLVEPPGGGGHNLVVDGYNTYEYYHFNFGWGGSSNGWYTLPPTNIAYNLTIIEGAVVDIKSVNYTGNAELFTGHKPVVLYPNPVTDRLNIRTESEGCLLQLYTCQGSLVLNHLLEGTKFTADLSDLPRGIYLIRVSQSGVNIYTGKVIRN